MFIYVFLKGFKNLVGMFNYIYLQGQKKTLQELNILFGYLRGNINAYPVRFLKPSRIYLEYAITVEYL